MRSLFKIAWVFASLGLAAPLTSVSAQAVADPEANTDTEVPEIILSEPDPQFLTLFNAGDYGGSYAVIDGQARQCINDNGGRNAGPENLAPCFLLTTFLAQNMMRLGQIEAAIAVSLLTAQIGETIFSEDSYELGLAYLNLGVAYEGSSAFNQAYPYLERAVAVTEKALGPEHPELAPSLSRLAVVSVQLGQYPKALELIRRAMAISTDPVLTAFFRLTEGQALRSMGRLNEAEATLEQGYQQLVELRGANHDMTLGLLHAQALVLDQQNRLEEAVATLERLLAGRRAINVPAGQISDTLSSLGLAQMKLGQFLKAERSLREGLELTEQVYGPGSGQAALEHNNLGLVLLQQRKVPEGVAHLRTSLEILKQNQDITPDQAAVILTNTGIGLMVTEQKGEALQVSGQAVDLAKKSIGPLHPRTLLLRSNYAVALADSGEQEEGMRLMASIYEDSVGLGEQSAQISSATATGLAYHSQQAGRFDDARKWFARAEQWGRIGLRPGHPQRISQLVAYAKTLIAQNVEAPLARTLLVQAGDQVNERISRYPDFGTEAEQELRSYSILFEDQVEVAWRLANTR